MTLDQLMVFYKDLRSHSLDVVKQIGLTMGFYQQELWDWS